MQIGILEPDGFSSVARERLSGLGSVSNYDGGDLNLFLGDKDALFVRLRHHIGTDFLQRAPKLRFLCSPTTGQTHIDVDELAKRGMKLISLKGESDFLDRIHAAPEHTIGLILALLRNYRSAFLDRHNSHWDRDRCRGEEISGMAIGLIGFGRVGQRVATYLNAFGATIGCYDPDCRDAETGVRLYPSVSALIDASWVIVLTASYEPNTAPIINRNAIAALEGKYFVNTARGELVDEEALLAAVEQGRLAGCAVDVICNETGQNNLERWIAATRAPNVIITPHIGGATFASMRATEEFVADKLVAAVKDRDIGGPMRTSR